MIDLTNITIEKAHNSLTNREYTVRELVDAYLKNIDEKNANINAYLEIYKSLDEQIVRAQKMIDDGSAGVMTGIPVSIKDNMLVTGEHASASSKMLEGFVAVSDATVIAKLKSAGAVLIGRTNMDEFAMGSSTETSAYGITRNPLNPDYVPGGSSGGAVSSVAMDGALVALGSDTGGSIRQPAGYTGLVGFKPTYGEVSRSGIIAMASSLDQVGPIAKTVADAEILFNIIRGVDVMDETSISETVVRDTREIKKIGVPTNWIEQGGIEASVKKNFDETVEKLKNEGYEIVSVDLPITQYSLAVYYVLNTAEVSSNLARYDGLRYGLSKEGKTLQEVYEKTRGQGFGKEVRRRILLGAYILSHGYYDAYYKKALDVQNVIRGELAGVFKKVDVIMTPTAPFLPFKFGEKMNDPIAMKLADLFLAPANIAGNPALSIPSGDAEGNLKHSTHFLAPMLADDALLSFGKKVEKIMTNY
ncbi:MAG: Asp-tRNA(Asn)/Glu-tRNA(Gln) amidotransferase subunit GatA [bacterium]